ncbi:hypothetical protein [Aquimarina aquimarini]|uniref:hypothetical protein n=1 Tax=Aquimarina aquimarini TaxID=1191734 RepID=UPI000D55B4D5|nr:hypothetical protein [Aquimarina aquimarini]
MRDFGTDILKDTNQNKDSILLRHLRNIKPSDEFISYLVALKYYEGDKDAVSKRIDYRIGIEYLGEDSQKLPHVFRLYKKELFFNRKKPSLIIEEIATALSSVIYPLEITVDHRGKFTSIINHDQIKKRWPAVKRNILKEYRGDITFKIIKKFEETIKDHKKLETSLYREIFWSIFYHPVYIGHNEELKKETSMLFPLEPYDPLVVYKGATTISPIITEYNTIQVQFNGQSTIPNKSRFHLEKKEHVITSDLQIDYDLDQNTRIPNLIHTTCDIYDETDEKEIKAIELLVTRQEGDQYAKSSFMKKENKQPDRVKVKPKKRDWFFGFKKKQV